ncbi:fimbrial protein [Serratia rubidaea]|nr:fimbrial protein [Serratia rubidaea]
MLRIVSLFLWVWVMASVPQAEAACSGCNQNITLNLNKQLSAADNTPGHTEASSSFTIGSFDTGYGTGYKGTTFTRLDGSMPPFSTAPQEWVYQKVDDYLSVAVRLRQQCGYIYAPFNRNTWAANTCQVTITSGAWGATTWDSSIRIDRKLVNGSYSKNILLGIWGGCNGLNCGRQDQVYARVYLQYSITVPQNCELNAGQVVNIDFGNISSGAFNTAGGKAAGVNPVSKNIGIQCNNIAAQANLTLRVQADNVSGNAIVSNNKDVGFVVTDGSNRELTPNSTSSVIPFTLDDSARADVTIKVYPVSVTGNKPAEGVVTSLAYLRVDFA